MSELGQKILSVLQAHVGDHVGLPSVLSEDNGRKGTRVETTVINVVGVSAGDVSQVLVAEDGVPQLHLQQKNEYGDPITLNTFQRTGTRSFEKVSVQIFPAE